MSGIQIFVVDELTGRTHGPYSLDEIVAQVQKNKLKKTHLVRKSDYSKWYKAEDLLGKVFDAVELEKREQVRETNSERKERRRHLLESWADKGRGALAKLKGSKESPEDVLALYEDAKSKLKESIKAFSGDRKNKDKALAAWNACELFDEITQKAKTVLKGDERIRDFEKETFQEDIWVANGGSPVISDPLEPVAEMSDEKETKECPFCGGVTLNNYVICTN